MKRCVIVLASLGWLAVGCTGNKYGAGPDVYTRQQVDNFQTETMEDPFSEEYRIRVGDRLDVVFVFNPDLSTPNLLVRPDGRITLPYVGDVLAAGRTPMELDTLLTESFSEIIRDPNLSVIVIDTPGRLIYVLGEVKRPEAVRYETEISLMQALAGAGGLLPSAKEEYTLILRREGPKTVKGLRVDVKSIMQGQTIGNDIMLQDGDVLFIPQTRLASVADVMAEIQQIVGPPLDFTLRALQTRTLLLQLETLQNN